MQQLSLGQPRQRPIVAVAGRGATSPPDSCARSRSRRCDCLIERPRWPAPRPAHSLPIPSTGTVQLHRRGQRNSALRLVLVQFTHPAAVHSPQTLPEVYAARAWFPAGSPSPSRGFTGELRGGNPNHARYTCSPLTRRVPSSISSFTTLPTSSATPSRARSTAKSAATARGNASRMQPNWSSTT